MGQSETASQHSTIASSATSEFFLPEGRSVHMFHSELLELSRYNNVTTIPRKKKRVSLKPSTTTFPYFPNASNSDQASGRENCAPWKTATHPDGALYFYDPKRRLFTDTDMYNTDLREEMEMFYLHLDKTIRFENLTVPSKKNYDLVLDIMPTETEKSQWSYYFACHKTRCLFWLDTYDASSEIYGVESPAHITSFGGSILGPLGTLSGGRRLPLYVYDELLGMLAHGCIDTLTSKFSTLPYDDEKMQKMIGLVKNVKGAKAGLEHYTAATTRLLCFFGNERIRTDEIIIETTWKTFMTKLQDEWIGFVLWSTVMLAVNVGFLSIPGVMFSSTNGDTLKSVHQEIILPSSSQVASTLSAEASIGSILIGLFLVRHNRTKQDLDPTGAATYLSRSSQRILGLEAMAIIFSLPWALLLWSYVV
ncbi:hypothetical protein V8E52_009779 [Russula decolorans]